MDEVVLKTYLSRLTSYEKDWKKIEGEANSLIIDSEDAQINASDMLAQIKTLTDAIEGKRVEIYNDLYPQSHRNIVKKVNNVAKAYKGRLEGMKKVIKQKYLAYDRRVREEEALAEAKRIEEERKNQERATAFIPENLKGEVAQDPAPTKEVSKPARANMVSTGLGSSYKKQVKSFQIEDFAKVPDIYKMIDEGMVREAMKQTPQPEIPGIRWTVEEDLVTRTR